MKTKSISKFNQIVNPKTNRKVNTNSKSGREILEKYKKILNISQQGGAGKGADWWNIFEKLQNKIHRPIEIHNGYYGLFLDGGWGHGGWGPWESAGDIIKTNLKHLKDANQWRFTPDGTNMLLPEERGSFSMLLIDPTNLYDNGVPTIAGYVVATEHHNDQGVNSGAPFVVLDYIEVCADYQGNGICRPMVSSMIDALLKNKYTSFKIWNDSASVDAARRCYVKASWFNKLDVFNAPYWEGQGNYPIDEFCKIPERHDVNYDAPDPEYYYMLKKKQLPNQDYWEKCNLKPQAWLSAKGNTNKVFW
tara:strand:+ start:711 stop:1625 length:915 start_codon:yes stop_codon:yes gene_type:complete